jgi:hypothetical protein
MADKKVINISSKAHELAKMASTVGKVKLNEYVSELIVKHTPKYDLKPSK